MGCVELLWARGPGIPEVAGQVAQFDLAILCAIKVEREPNQWYFPVPPIPEFQQYFHLLMDHLHLM